MTPHTFAGGLILFGIFLAGYLLGRRHQSQDIEAEVSPILDDMTRTLGDVLVPSEHPGAQALREWLEEGLQSYEASTSPADRDAQHFEGEWEQAADLTRKLLALLGAP